MPAQVAAMVEGLQAQSDQALSAQGIEPESFYQYCRDNHPKAVQAAMMAHFQTQSLDAYAPLLEAFKAAGAPAAPAMPASRQPAAIDDGKELVTIDGVTLSRKVARRIGLL